MPPIIKKALKSQSLVFGAVSTAIYAYQYWNVIAKFREFQIAFFVLFFVSSLLWHLYIKNNDAKASKIILFSILYGLIHFGAFYTTINLYLIYENKLHINIFSLGYFAADYFVTGVTGITKSMAACLIATPIVKILMLFPKVYSLKTQHQENQITAQIDFFDKVEISLNGLTILKQKKTIIRYNKIEFTLPTNNGDTHCSIEIFKQPLICKTKINATIHRNTISSNSFNWFDGLSLIDATIASILFITFQITTTAIFKPFVPAQTNNMTEFLLSVIILTQIMASSLFSALGTHIFSQFYTKNLVRRYAS